MEQRLVDNNKLIALSPFAQPFDKLLCEKAIANNNTKWLQKNLRYDSDLEKLFGVVYRIEDAGHGFTLMGVKNGDVVERSCVIFKDNTLSESLASCTAAHDVKIVVYVAVIKFITWYNETQCPSTSKSE